MLEVKVAPPDGKERSVTDGVYARDEVIASIKKAAEVIEAAKPDRIITIGGNCIVSQAPFDYLHGIYDNAGIIWIDDHPDVSTVKDGYPNAHVVGFTIAEYLPFDEHKLHKMPGKYQA